MPAQAPTSAPEPTPVRRRRRRRTSSSKGARRRNVRIFYFSFAALWGFAVGTASLMGTMIVLGQRLEPDSRTIWFICGAAVLSVVGGLIVDAAYRETGRRIGWRRR